jgi:hypothetical protein
MKPTTSDETCINNVGLLLCFMPVPGVMLRSAHELDFIIVYFGLRFGMTNLEEMIPIFPADEIGLTTSNYL